MRILITGANGFAGRHLIDYARPRATVIAGMSRHTPLPHDIRQFEGDFLDPATAAHAVREFLPDLVFHLAAQTPANAPQARASEWLTVNSLSTYYLLDAVRRFQSKARIVVISSSAVYGHVAALMLPVTEDMPLRPTTLYGVSKASQEFVALSFVYEHGLHVVCARSFNLIGPGEPAGMVTSILAAQVAAVAQGTATTIRLRHRATKRDYTDIRDAVRAYWLLGKQGKSGQIYNVCTGVATSINELVCTLLAHAGIDAPVEETHPQIEPHDIVEQSGSMVKLNAATGWQPIISLPQSLADLLGTYTGSTPIADEKK